MDSEQTPALCDFFSKHDFTKCFFTGRDVKENEETTVFPEWVLDRYNMRDQYMGMLNWNRIKYGEITLRCHPDAKKKIDEFENTVKQAFEGGYDAVMQLPQDTIFLWMSKLLLGILYHDILYSLELGGRRHRPFRLSPLLTRKYRDLHFMMQAIVSPVKWTVRPYSIVVKKLNYSKDIFNFRDETKNQNFSLAMNGFGIIGCLQDRGVNLIYHKELLDKMGDTTLHAIQFEELCARFIYSNYLLKQNQGYHTEYKDGFFVMNPLDKEPVYDFGKWEDKMFASVLEDYFKPWGIEPKEIYTFPDTPLSFLINESTNNFIRPEEIKLQS